MVLKKSSKKVSFKKSSGRRRRNYKKRSPDDVPSIRSTNRASSSMGGLQPEKKRIRLTMTDIYRANFGGVTGVTTLQMRANSVNSPGVTFTYHQPYLYDQMVVLYQSVCVYRTLIDVWITNESTTHTYDFYIGNAGTLTPTYSSYLDVLYDMERSRGLNCYGIAPQSTRHCKYWVNPSKALGKSSSEYNDSLFCEATSTTINTYVPTYQIPVNFCTICSDTTATDAVTINFRMTYFCEFFDKKQTAKS